MAAAASPHGQPNYRLIIFDFDGTLADSFLSFVAILNQAALRHHFRSIPLTELETLRGLDARRLMQYLGIPRWKLPFVARTLHRLLRERVGSVELFPGIAALIERLHAAGCVIALVSSNSRENMQRILGPELSRKVHFMEGKAPIFGKASRLARVLKKSGVPREEALSVGDELRDLEASRKAGLAFGAVAWGYTRLEAFLELAPEEVFRSVAELEARLLKNSYFMRPI